MRTVLAKLLKTSPLFRFMLIPLAFALFAGFFLGIERITHKKPELTLLEPATAQPGEVIVIHGAHFGKSRETTMIEFRRPTFGEYHSRMGNNASWLSCPDRPGRTSLCGDRAGKAIPSFSQQEQHSRPECHANIDHPPEIPVSIHPYRNRQTNLS